MTVTLRTMMTESQVRKIMKGANGPLVPVTVGPFVASWTRSKIGTEVWAVSRDMRTVMTGLNRNEAASLLTKSANEAAREAMDSGEPLELAA